MNSFTLIRRISALALLAVLTGCAIHPSGEREERDAARLAGRPFEKAIGSRQIPALPENATPDQIVEYALLSNAELEQRYWEWRSAIEQIPQDGSQSTTLNLSAGTSITHGRASWGSSTLALANDPMTDIKWPGKLDAAAKQSLENARAAGARFSKAKFDVRNKVLSAYYDYALNSELIRLEQSNQQLLRTTATITQSRSRAGNAGQGDMLKAENEADLSGNEIATMQSQLQSQRSIINALLGRPADSPLLVSAQLPISRPLAYGDGQLVDLAARDNPELRALSDEIRSRREGIRLAELQYVPDFNLSAGTDLIGVTQSVLGQMTVPVFRYEALNAAIAQAQANLRASQAMRRQTRDDLAARVIADITTIRDADRQLDLFEQSILPRSLAVAKIGRSAYETGHASLLDLLDDQRSSIGILRLIAKLKVAREEHLVDLESITKSDLTSLHAEN